MKRFVVFLVMLLIAPACAGDADPVRFDEVTPPAVETPSTSSGIVVAPSSATTAAPAETAAIDDPAADVLDAYVEAMAEGDVRSAAALLAFETVYFFDLVAALASSGVPAEFDRAPLLAGLLAGVLRGFDATPFDGEEAFIILAGLGQIPTLPLSGAFEWYEDRPGVRYGLVEGTAYVTMSNEDGEWKVDLTQSLIISETQRYTELLGASGLGEDATTADLLFEPTGFIAAGPPLPREGGAMSLLPAPAWGRFLRAVDSMEWMQAYGMLGSITLIDDTRGVPAIEIARTNALTGTASTFAGLTFADALLALTVRATYSPDQIATVPGAEIFGLAMEAGVVKLAATSEDLAWQTTSGIRFLGRSPTEAAGVFRSGWDWIVDGNVIVASEPSDFAATEGIAVSDRIAVLLAALNQITGGSYDAAILDPVG